MAIMTTNSRKVVQGIRKIHLRQWITPNIISSSAVATAHDEPWPLLRLLSIGPDPTNDFRLQFLTPIIIKSSSESSHVIACLPSGLVPSRSGSLLYRDSTFQGPTPKCLILLGRFGGFH
jgi:hypothetical protein